MKTSSRLGTRLLCGAAVAAILASAGAAQAEERPVRFEIPAQPLTAALNEFGIQSGSAVLFKANVTGARLSRPLSGAVEPELALTAMLDGTGLSYRREGDAFVIVQGGSGDPQSGSAAGAGAEVEALIVTAQKREEDIQDVPIAISAFSQETLTERQVAGGPDLITQIPNFTFTKTNFSGYSIQIRGIGTQAISATTDPAVAVASNGVPFIRNHFFEQEFYDVASVEVLRGPQGTLFGRNATAGVVNVVSAKPKYTYESKLSADLGNYDTRRLEGMINIPLIDDRLALRVAGAWTKRDGYSFNETTNRPVDGRDLWATRVSLRYEPVDWIRADLIWEHFQEDDDRIRSGKQLCKKDPGLTDVDGLDLTTIPNAPFQSVAPAGFNASFFQSWLSQGCLPTSLYSDEAFQTPHAQAMPFVAAAMYLFGGGPPGTAMIELGDPYAGQTQSRDLRVFQSELDPTYSVRHDVVEFNVDVDLGEHLTLTSQSGYSKGSIRSTQDFNRFNTARGVFTDPSDFVFWGAPSPIEQGGVYCDPQLGCATSMVGSDLSRARSRQFSQELRLASEFEGPFDFSIGANFLRYKTEEDYFAFFNLLTAMSHAFNGSPPGQYNSCLQFDGSYLDIEPVPFIFQIFGPTSMTSNFSCRNSGQQTGTYIDPNPIDRLDGLGHNYFRSKNPYRVMSRAVFGEAYYHVTPDLKLTAGLRWTNDRKVFSVFPSQAFLMGGGYPELNVIEQEWKETTGRLVVDWSPDLAFTDDTMLFASYARGYKGGGANPPGPAVNFLSYQTTDVLHPKTFEPEFVDAYEIGAKNVLLDGALTLNGSAFYYDYKNYQISQIVDRTSINLNFDAEIMGLELEGSWRPSEALGFNFALGLQESSVADGESAIDMMDRTNGEPGWIVVKPFIADTSNCILPDYVVREVIEAFPIADALDGLPYACMLAYAPNSAAASIGFGFNTRQAIIDSGFDGSTAPNDGAGFSKDLSGNNLPNTPQFTLSLGTNYSFPVREGWLATVRADGYWAGNSYTRIFNEEPYDKLRHRTNLNVAAILTSENGWQIMGYVKNVFDDDFITGAFLLSDDTALTTNVFLNEPRLFGVRITKEW